MLLTPDQINALPIRRFEGEIRLVETHQDVEHATADFAQERVVGFDTETRPSFKPGQSYPPALAQIATARAVYLFPLLRMDFAQPLGRLLSSETKKAGVGLADDVRQLHKSFAFTPSAMVDLGAIARSRGMEKSGVRVLAAAFLGFRVPKGTKTSNWAAARLSPQQIAYAATDAWVCRELYLAFAKEGWV